ncbi:MAG TPA: hypothetical protein VKT52_01670, partial [Ktedonobacterales bacterium]|nr:hypothetical protein [Ktedonobacterales bacterium]
LAEQGWSLEHGAARVQQRLRAAGVDLRAPIALDGYALRTYPTTWAKRLAFGRDPRAIALCGTHCDALSGERSQAAIASTARPRVAGARCRGSKLPTHGNGGLKPDEAEANVSFASASVQRHHPPSATLG